MNNEMRELNSEYPIFYSEKQQRAFMQNKISYHPRSGVCFCGGKKTAAESVTSGGAVMVEKKFFDFALSGRAELASGRVTADGRDITDGLSHVPVKSGNKYFYPLRDILEALGMCVREDNSAISGGMIAASDSDFALPKDGAKPTVPYVKEIGAYMMTSSPLQELNDFLLYLRPDADRLAADYKKSPLCGVHPRILLDKTDFERLKRNVQTDEKMSAWYKLLLNEADGLCCKPPLEYVLTDGVRLWFVSNWFNARIQTLSLAYILSEDKKYADRAKTEMLAIAGFKDWHPEHHLDVAAMAIGFAIGYDWLYDTYSAEERETFEKSVYKNGYIDYIKGFKGESGYMAEGISFGNNHNAVMNSGAVIMALAFADIYPRESFYLISGAIRAAENMLHRYAPLGAWYEGVPYGAMTLNFMAYHWAAADKIFGTNYTLECSEGADKAVEYIVKMQGAAGPYTFSDAESDGACRSVVYDPAILWFAKYFGNDSIQEIWFSMFNVPLAESELVRTLLWYSPELNGGGKSLELDAYYPENNIAIMHSSWQPENQVTVGIKGGRANVEHGHMDMGSFEYFRGKTRWIDDVGADDYNLYKFFWGFTRDGERWSYFRERAEAHSCLIINPDRFGEYDPNRDAVLTRISADEHHALYRVDMTESFGAEKVLCAYRYFELCDNRQSLVVRDEVQLLGESELYWCAYTNELAGIFGNRAVLTAAADDSKKLEMDFLCSHDFELFKTKPEALKETAEFVRSAHTYGTRLVLKAKASGKFTLTVKLTPAELEDKSDISEYNRDYNI